MTRSPPLHCQAMDTVSKKDIFGMTKAELQELCAELGMPKFAAGQICDWLYIKRVVSFEEMTNVSKANRTLLTERCRIGRSAPVTSQKSIDGTIKYLYETDKGQHIEAVYIPDEERATLCISSQVGCKRACRFCMTGQMGLQGQLSSGEILNQIFSLPDFDKLTNVVYMGMGEPLDNPDEVMRSLEVLTSPWGLAWSPKRITLSTIGILPSLRRFLEESKAHLAVSMHNPLGEERLSFMPVEKVYPIEDVIRELRKHDFSGQRRVSFEYIMFDGVNDSMEHADAVVRLVNGLKCRFNLIRFHSFPGAPFDGSGDEAILRFQARLKAKGLTCTIRASRGQDILAACGMLSTKEGES